MIKKTAAVLLACAILLSCVSGFCEEETDLKEFDCPTTQETLSDTAVSDLLESAELRASLTICLLADYTLYGDSDDVQNHADLLTNETHIYYSDDCFMVAYYSGSNMLTLFYDPASKAAASYWIDTGIPAESMPDYLNELDSEFEVHFTNEMSVLLPILAQMYQDVNGEE